MEGSHPPTEALLLKILEGEKKIEVSRTTEDWQSRAVFAEQLIVFLAGEARKILPQAEPIVAFGSSALRSEIVFSRNNSMRRSNSQGSIKLGKKPILITTAETSPEYNLETSRPPDADTQSHTPVVVPRRASIALSHLRKTSIVDSPLPKVVLSNPKAKVLVDVEVPLHSKVQRYDLTTKKDIYYDQFYWRAHWNWVGTLKTRPSEVFILSVLKEPENGVFKGVKNGSSGFAEFSFEVKGKVKGKKALIEKKITDHWPGIRIVDFCEVKNDEIQSIEAKFPQSFSAFDVTVLEVLNDQTNPQDMFLNKTHSPQFDKFLKIMDITLPLTEKTEFDWSGKKVRYLLASQLNEEQIRRLIGNTENVILFTSSETPFDPVDIDKIGAIPQTFIVVQAYSKASYRIGSFHRFDSSFPPFVPKGYIFGTIDLKDFILTKIYNGLMVSRQCPPYSIMYERPRQSALKDIVEKYVSGKNLAYLYGPRN